jgi:RsiW-degrading membrane proteinase PrsW (M82 family)
MQPSLGVAAPARPLAPPYPARLLIASPAWSSRLAHDGGVILSKPEVHLGLLATNDVVFKDPHVSRLHAVIRWTPAGYEIEDLHSTGGTYVQGLRVTARTLLPPGAAVRIGTVELRFEPLAAPPIQAPPGVVGAPLPSTISPAPTGYPGYLAAGASYRAARPSRLRPSRLRAWFGRQAPKRYWRVFLLGLLAYIAADLLVNFDLNRHAIPLVILLASALVPVTFVIFCWEEGAFADMPATIVGLTFVSGAVVGLLVAGFLEDLFLIDVPIFGPFIVGIIEEGAKAGAVVWFLRDRRLRSELDGLVLGAAAGMGFATLETAGYGFNAFLGGYTNALGNHASTGGAVSAGIAAMTFVLILRMILAVFGHGVWTAIVCAAIWRERGPAVLRITGSVLLAFAISVTLHALWDSVGAFPPLSLLFWPLVAFSGLWILRFFIHEAVDRAKLGSLAPPPAPLSDALVAYLRHPRRRPPMQPLYGPARVAPVVAYTPAAGPTGGYTVPPAHLPVHPPASPPAGYPSSPPSSPAANVPPVGFPSDATQATIPATVDSPCSAPPDEREILSDATGVSSGAASPVGEPRPLAADASTGPVDAPGRVCPNGHAIADGTQVTCPQCDAPLAGVIPPGAG